MLDYLNWQFESISQRKLELETNVRICDTTIANLHFEVANFRNDLSTLHKNHDKLAVSISSKDKASNEHASSTVTTKIVLEEELKHARKKVLDAKTKSTSAE